MTIAAASPSQKASGYTASGTSITAAYPNNVAANSLLTVVAVTYTGTTNDPPTAADLTKSAGTATIGAVSMDRVDTRTITGSFYIHAAQFSVLVTGAGSLTLQLAGAPAASAMWIAVDEYTGYWDSTRAEAVNSNEGASNSPDSGNVTTVGAGLVVGGLIVASASGSTVTENSAFSLIAERNGTATELGASAISQIVTFGTTESASWTVTNAPDWIATVVAYKEAQGPAATAYQWNAF